MFIMGIAVLLFGKRLPEVGRSLGRGIVEFKKGLNGVGDEFDSSSSSSRYSSSYSSSSRSEESSSGSSAYSDASVPKFELPGKASSSESASAPATAPTPQMEYQPPPRD
jgi:sec-independent protein translocase protein TatA